MLLSDKRNSNFRREIIEKKMIGKDNNTEEVVFKVNDRRKFNADGSPREGFEAENPKPKEEAAALYEPTADTVETYENAPPEIEPAENELAGGEELLDDDTDIPGAEDPASFVNFLTTLASQAAAALGAMPHPATGKRTVDLETGKYWIEVLAMLKEKTQNNLHPKEQELFDGLLSDLRMQFVQISRMAEEQLKQKAAQKFSAQDILGKK